MSETHKHIELVGTVTVGSKGQVVIPAEVRENMGVEPGDKLVALYLPDKKSVGFVSEGHIQTIINQMGKHVERLRDALN